MNTTFFSYCNLFYFRLNILSLTVGIIIGMVISIFETAVNEKLVASNLAIANIVFSVIITLVVANSFYTFERYRKGKKTPLWQFIIVYCVGLTIGYEASFLTLSFIYHFHYDFRSHLSDYRLSLLIGTIVAIGIYLYRTQQVNMKGAIKAKELDLVKAKQLTTQAELQTLQSKINPHFLYNSLNSIAGIIRKDADKAEDMTLKLSRLFRYSINSPQENMASVSEEMDIVDTYLAIEKVRFGDKLDFEIHIDDDIKNERIPRFLIQPLVENALKHGLNVLPGRGELKISINRDEKNIAICVADSGKPFPEELAIGYGLQSTYDKLDLLYGENYQVQIANSPKKHIRILVPVVK